MIRLLTRGLLTLVVTMILTLMAFTLSSQTATPAPSKESDKKNNTQPATPAWNEVFVDFPSCQLTTPVPFDVPFYLVGTLKKSDFETRIPRQIDVRIYDKVSHCSVEKTWKNYNISQDTKDVRFRLLMPALKENQTFELTFTFYQPLDKGVSEQYREILKIRILESDVLLILKDSHDLSDIKGIMEKVHDLFPCNTTPITSDCENGDLNQFRTLIERSEIIEAADNCDDSEHNFNTHVKDLSRKSNLILFPDLAEIDSLENYLRKVNDSIAFEAVPYFELRQKIGDYRNTRNWVEGRKSLTNSETLGGGLKEIANDPTEIMFKNRQDFFSNLINSSKWFHDILIQLPDSLEWKAALNTFFKTILNPNTEDIRSESSVLEYRITDLQSNYKTQELTAARFAEDYVKIFVETRSIASYQETKVDFEARGEYFITSDLGLAYVPALSNIIPTFGLNFSLKALNRNARYNLHYLIHGPQLEENCIPDGFQSNCGNRLLKNLSVVLSITLSDVSKVAPQGLTNTFSEIEDTWKFSLLTGMGLRISDGVRISGGAMWVKNRVRAPLDVSAPLKPLGYASLSIDLDWGKYIEHFRTKVFKELK